MAPLSIEELCIALAQRYARPPDAIAVDTERFVQMLGAEVLVSLS